MKTILIFSLILHFLALSPVSAEEEQLSAREFMTQEYRNLVDIQEQIKYVRSRQSVGPIGIVISASVVGAVVFLTLSDISVNSGAKLFKFKFTKGVATSSLVYFGGKKLSKDSIVAYVESKNLDELDRQINRLKQEIEQTLKTVPRYTRRDSIALTDIRLLPSYQEVYNACNADPLGFKLDTLQKAYLGSIMDTLKVSTLAPKSIFTMTQQQGISTFVHRFIYSETATLALVDCLSDEQERSLFMANILLADTAGKMVGLSVAGLSGKLMSGLTGKALKFALKYTKHLFTWVTPALSKKLTYAAMAIFSASYLNQVRELLKEYQLQSNDHDISLEKDLEQKILEMANANIENLKEVIADPEISAEEQEKFMGNLMEWNAILQNFQFTR
ncbi:MAG: hypothetical protein A2504_01745 [Bdellovibrionales bacterium RIFOXYD12_FULL_39_22]|nr:MAG: hypothetical protein A2385_04270 [Bdellovibrionales bacterium RIFOXYB1_FULL_39_21]OFZ42371.1 MAG: hypothetical protein A2485_15225 [Bdellovibrionales bacterium RIFOXYC12_FULL_39_17]OFZ46328.1 MAG: hypothetical protein A2404_13790 [Bdellovibrionales bacterium RIFOXYC1_FULL_39_130]OFZ72497.1 MAG: hypothetical protein A2451_11350 [Bdellovibrionales bacterium RIFOXYC2_FULL_39_8]OFZ75221.1 MAG: hypothetical protein A2560_15845 [Bdellovibrionales bacterium RIFOXYD1_FULL_39_84]OFZ93215.1 MAG: